MNMEIDSGPSKEPQAKKNEIKTEHPQVSHLNVPLLKQNALPAYLNSHMSTLRLKTDARVPRDIKRSICKRCKAQLINDQTSSTSVENKSRGGKKAMGQCSGDIMSMLWNGEEISPRAQGTKIIDRYQRLNLQYCSV